MLVRPPYRLPVRIRQLLDEYLERHLPAPPVIPDRALVERKIRQLRRSQSRWIVDLGRVAAGTWQLLDAAELPSHGHARAALVIAIHYLVEPHDIIPDTVTEHGHLDDFHMMHMCVEIADKEQPEIIRQFFVFQRGQIADVSE